MNQARSMGRMLGVLLLLQLIVGIWLNFGLTAPAFAPPGFLENAAAHPLRLGSAALIGLTMGLLGLLALSLFWPYAHTVSPLLARVYAGLIVAGLVLSVLEQASQLSMLSLSQAYHAQGGEASALYQGLRGVVAEQRNWVHFLDKLYGGVALMLFHLLLWRGRLVPRGLSGLGVLTCAGQIIGVAHPLLGGAVPMLLLAPLALAQLLLSLWLLARGLTPPSATAHDPLRVA